jgi:hypothetical protein
MGEILGLETITGQNPPRWFTRTDSKQLLRHLTELRWNSSSDELVKLKDHLGADLEPLGKIASEHEPLESFLARDPSPERETFWHKMHAEYEAAWQDPGILASSIEAFLTALQDGVKTYAALGIGDPYFIDGFFEQDTRDLLAMLKWAQDQGIPKVRLLES